MNCEQVKKQIPEWLDGELEAARAETIENHLFYCASCRKEADFWKAVGTALQEGGKDIKAPEGFALAVMAQLPKQQNNGRPKIVARWKRGIAAAAAFVLVSAGAATGYLQWGINAAPRVADNNSGQAIIANHETGAIIDEEPGPRNNPTGDEPGVQSGGDSPVDTGTQQPGEQENQGSENNPGSQANPSSGTGVSNNGNADAGEAIDPGELALMNTSMERVIERTFVQIKVDDFDTAHARMLEYINGVDAGYEVIASENTAAGSQESLKIVVDNSKAGVLLENLFTLGRVVARDNTSNTITKEYNANVEQLLLLKDQFEACDDVHERQQLQVKISGIMGQLKTWDQEARKKTIILMLEN